MVVREQSIQTSDALHIWQEDTLEGAQRGGVPIKFEKVAMETPGEQPSSKGLVCKLAMETLSPT